MRYILPAGALLSINFLRKNYEEKRKVNLDVPPSLFGVPTMFGGTDVASRDKQTRFIQKMIVVLRANLAKEEDITNAQQWEANLTASRVILAACLFVQSQISSPKSNSALYNLINQHLGITSTNYMDEEDQEMCHLAANRVINSSIGAYSEANATLRENNLKPFTEKEWKAFSEYVAEQATKAKQPKNPYTNYPITSITQPFFGAAFTYTGATIGYLSGDIMSQSSTTLSTKAQLTTYVGSTILMLGTAGPMGVALFSQIIASKLVTSFFSISMAHLLGTAAGLVGQGVGVGIGMPLDLAYRLLWKAAATVGTYYSTYPNDGKMTGLRISDGKTVINGIVLDYSTNDELAKDLQNKTVTITEDQKLLIDGKELKIPSDGASLPLEVINELKRQINLRELAKKETKVTEPTDEEKEGLLTTSSTL
jgi:hypothetical protein